MEDAADVLEELYSGDYGSHSARGNLAQKVLRQGYYWPAVHKDAEEYAKKYPSCQVYDNVLR